MNALSTDFSMRAVTYCNPDLAQLQSYPFEKLRVLFQGVPPPSNCAPINLGIGEPKHATSQLIQDAFSSAVTELSFYPSTQGSEALRKAMSQWITRRYDLLSCDPNTQVIPVNGSREALFSIAQTVVGRKLDNNLKPIVVCPNPFYQIYEGAALLAGAQTYFVNADPNRNFAHDYQSVPDTIWARTQLVFVCSPDNPSGAVMSQEEWRDLFALSDRYGFVIVSDECYSEIYFAEERAPLGALSAAQKLGRTDFHNLLICSSLSKRSNVPGLRSGFVAGDADLIAAFTRYRTYHGCAMGGAVQKTSLTAWQDEAHVIENRRLYAQKFAQVIPILATVLPVTQPAAGFYVWTRVDDYFDDTEFAKNLYRSQGVTVLPGSYLARPNDAGVNPGKGFVRMALVAPLEECVMAAHRIVDFLRGVSKIHT